MGWDLKKAFDIGFKQLDYAFTLFCHMEEHCKCLTEKEMEARLYTKCRCGAFRQITKTTIHPNAKRGGE